MKIVVFIILVLFGIAAVLTGLSALAYRPTVDTAVNRMIDESYRANPLDDALLVEESISGSDGRVWVVAAVVLAAVVGIVGFLAYLYLGAEHAKRKSALIRASKSSASSSQPIQPAAQGPWLLPPDQIPAAQRALPAPDSNAQIAVNQNNEYWG